MCEVSHHSVCGHSFSLLLNGMGTCFQASSRGIITFDGSSNNVRKFQVPSALTIFCHYGLFNLVDTTTWEVIAHCHCKMYLWLLIWIIFYMLC